MTIVDLRQDIFFPLGAFVSVRTGVMLPTAVPTLAPVYTVNCCS
jgi:hypothetical protein